MTPTAAELLSDPAFLEKRMREQLEYMHQYDQWFRQQEMECEFLLGEKPKPWRITRYQEVMTSANHQIAFYRETKEELLR